MRVESNFISIKRKTLSYFVIVVLTLGTVTPVLADYLGPDRTTTTSEVDTYDYGVWARDNNKVPYCLDKKGNKADDCIVCEWKRKPGNACGDATYSYKLGTISEVVEKTINLPPATISSSLQNCSSNNGWCNTLPTLTLNGSEPLSGYNILAIEGSLNGQAFACSGSVCDVPLNEGNNDFTFWALSSYGDSSEMGTLSAKVDTAPPNVGLDVIGSNGTNNWYVSPTMITATGSDSTSGLSNVLLSVNGGAWTASTTLNDGIYAVDVRAEDNAGNVSTSSTAIVVDTVTPSITLNVSGAMGSNGWYSSNMQVTASASDLTSGIASLEVSADGGVYQAYASPVSFADGYHTIRFKAVDKAGNQTETPVQEFYVDATAPAIDLPSAWEVDKTIDYKVQDSGSGLATLRIVIEDEDEKYKKVAWDEDVSGNKFKGEITWNGKFKDGTLAPPGEYLVWIKAKDKAGNERFGLGRVIVPQPTVFSLLQPTITNNQETLLPPQELFDEDELPVASSATPMAPQTSFGGSTTDPKETTQNSLSLATGTASASTATNSNILWGATAAALIDAMTAYTLDEKRKRKEQEANKLQEDYAKAAKLNAMEEQRKINAWLQGQAILNDYIEDLEKQAKSFDPEDPLYGQLEAQIETLKKQAAIHGFGVALERAEGVSQWLGEQEAKQEQLMRQAEAERERRAVEEAARRQAEAEEKQKAAELQAGLAAYYAATRQGMQESEEKPWWEKIANNFMSTLADPHDNIARVIGSIPDAWRGFLYSPLQIKNQIKGPNLVVSVNQETLNMVSSVTGWVEKNLPWTGVKAVPSNKLGYYKSLGDQGLDIHPTGNLSPKSWIDDLLDIVLSRESKALAEEAVETTTKGGLRNSLKALSPAVFDAVIEGTFNAYDYTLGDKKNETDKLQKWAVSSGVDLGGSLLTGALAVGTVAGILYLVGGAITIPVTVIVVGTIAIGALFDVILESTGIKDSIKKILNAYIDSVQTLPTTPPIQPAVPVPTPSAKPHSTSTPGAVSPSSMPPIPTITPQVTPEQTPSPTPNQTPGP